MPRHVKAVLIVMDGLRPDAVTPCRMPRLAAFAEGAQWFRDARSVFPSMTRVATTSIATGTLPNRHGIVGNAVWLPDVAKDRILDLGRFEDVALATRVLDGSLVTADTFADRMAAEGLSVAMLSTSNAGTSRFLNPRADWNKQLFLATASAAASTPDGAHDAMIKRFGPVPLRGVPSGDLTHYATRLFCDYILGDVAPDVAAIWYCEPDVSYHYAGLTAPATDQILATLDACFADIVDRLPEDTTILLASDHGHLTIDRESNVLADLAAAGFPVADWRQDRIGSNDVKAAAWTSGALWLPDQRATLAHEISDALRAHGDVSIVLARDPKHGAVSLAAAGLDHTRAPDIAFCLSSSWENGGTGTVAAGGDVPIGGGMHGGLSAAEMNVTLIARGPGFEPGHSSAPAGICNIRASLERAAGLASGDRFIGSPLQDLSSSAPIPAAHEGHPDLWWPAITLS